MRKLASLKRVDQLLPIPGADRIEVAVVGGWKCVVKKGEFVPGDIGVYFEIDSIVPERPEFEFLRQSKFRVRSIILRGQLSQGLMLPVDALDINPNDISGNDVTELLGVKKWESEIVYDDPDMIAPLPGYLFGYDIERIQNLAEPVTGPIHTYMRDFTYEITEKLEGKNYVFWSYQDEVHAGSHSVELSTTSGVAYELGRSSGILGALTGYRGPNVAIYGERIGPGVIGNIYRLNSNEFRVFDVFLIDEGRFMTPTDRIAFLQEMRLSKLHIPILDNAFVLGDMTVDQILKMADGKSVLRIEQAREGLIFKSNELFNGRILTWKAVSNAYLIGGGQG
jgi:RNA ligase (TIGR02306 family)